MSEEILRRQTVFTGRQFALESLLVRLPDGREAQRDVVRHPGAVAIVATDEAERILLVRQFRIAAGKDGALTLELPAGTLEPGEAPLACAQRELREETGFRAEALRSLGGFYVAPGYTSEYIELFRATDLRPDPAVGDADEFISVVRMNKSEMRQAIQSGQINDAKTMIGLWLIADEWA